MWALVAAGLFVGGLLSIAIALASPTENAWREHRRRRDARRPEDR
jgi:hypothetical protein